VLLRETRDDASMELGEGPRTMRHGVDDHAHQAGVWQLVAFSQCLSLVGQRVHSCNHGIPIEATDEGGREDLRNRGSFVAIGPGRHAVVFLWGTADGPAPRALEHRLAVRVADRDFSVASVSVPVRDVAPIVIGPPLRGGPWLMRNGPSKKSPHWRALIPIGGHACIAQRFAIDFVKVDDDGKTFRGDQAKNESYFAYGAEALAVGDGVVTATKDGVPQNVPSPDDRALPITLETIAGNHVLVDLGGGRFAMWAHLQPGSVRVKKGDHVKRGQVLGLLGNSGNSTEPHLHFHVTDASSPLGAQGVPYAFDAFQLRAPDKSTSARKKQLPTEDEIVSFP
jgi:hypothetical protein